MASLSPLSLISSCGAASSLLSSFVTEARVFGSVWTEVNTTSSAGKIDIATSSEAVCKGTDALTPIPLVVSPVGTIGMIGVASL